VKRIYEDFIEKVKDEAYTGFERFLQETPLLNKDSPLEGEGFQELLEKLSVKILKRKIIILERSKISEG